MGEMIGKRIDLDPKKIAEEIRLRTSKMTFDVLSGCYILEDHEGNRMVLQPEIYLRIIECLERW